MLSARHDVPAQFRFSSGVLTTYVDAARRELMEEAGATLREFVPFGFWEIVANLGGTSDLH